MNKSLTIPRVGKAEGKPLTLGAPLRLLGTAPSYLGSLVFFRKLTESPQTVSDGKLISLAGNTVFEK